MSEQKEDKDRRWNECPNCHFVEEKRVEGREIGGVSRDANYALQQQPTDATEFECPECGIRWMG